MSEDFDLVEYHENRREPGSRAGKIGDARVATFAVTGTLRERVLKRLGERYGVVEIEERSTVDGYCSTCIEIGSRFRILKDGAVIWDSGERDTYIESEGMADEPDASTLAAFNEWLEGERDTP